MGNMRETEKGRRRRRREDERDSTSWDISCFICTTSYCFLKEKKKEGRKPGILFRGERERES